MNFTQLKSLIRGAMFFTGGGTVITAALGKYGVTGDQVAAGVAAANSYGDLAVSVVGWTITILSAVWTYKSHSVGALVDHAVSEAGKAASVGNVAPAQRAVAALKTHLSPNG